MNICEKCKKKINSMSRHQKYCDDCHNDSTQSKGGKINMDEKQEKYNGKIEKSASEDRNLNAEKLIEFMKKDLETSDADLTKLISRAYRIIKKK